MIRRTLPALFAACVFFPAVPLAAEEASALAIVTGIAPGDLLNVRAAASPVGHTETRLANGAGVKNFGCSEFNGYQWCKVEVVDQPGVAGWVPARYLLAVDPEGTATPSLDEAEIKAGTANAAPVPAEQGDAGDEKEAVAAPAVPPDLSARFGDGPPRAGGSAADDGKQAASGLSVAEADAYRLAFANRADAAAAAQEDGDGQTEAVAPSPDDQPAADDATAAPQDTDAAAPQEAGVAADVPVPTPRPDTKAGEQEATAKADPKDKSEVEVASASPAAGDPAKAAETPEPAIVALADPQSSPPVWDATGQIPCARYVGQPMTQCRVGIKREGSGKADVTVTFPDGGTRVIGFYDGKPAGANSRGEFRFTREGDLNMIRVGVSERFEITDALAFGD
jgi:uncharacterized protein YraI